jgi:hypothetical protein
MSEGGFSNFFIDELFQYYQQQGRSLADNVISVLNKSPFELNEEEGQIFKNQISAFRQGIKDALRERLVQTGASKDDWLAKLPPFSQTIIGMLTAEMLGEFVAPTIVETSISQPAPKTELEVPKVDTQPQPLVVGQAVTPPPPSAPQAAFPQKQSNRNKIIAIVGGCAVLALIIILVLVFALSGGNESSSTETATSGQISVDIKLEIISPTSYGGNSTGVSTVSGTTDPGLQVMISGCQGGTTTIKADSNGGFSTNVNLLEGTSTLTITATNGDKRAVKTVTQNYEIDPEAYKAQCQQIDFKELDKNPTAYKGQKYFTAGQVIQIMESAGSTDIRMNVTQGSYGYWSDTIYVTYTGTTPAVEDSIIYVYGEITGPYTYTSTAGYKITLPNVKAKYIDVVKQ